MLVVGIIIYLVGLVTWLWAGWLILNRLLLRVEHDRREPVLESLALLITGCGLIAADAL